MTRWNNDGHSLKYRVYPRRCFSVFKLAVEWIDPRSVILRSARGGGSHPFVNLRIRITFSVTVQNFEFLPAKTHETAVAARKTVALRSCKTTEQRTRVFEKIRKEEE